MPLPSIRFGLMTDVHYDIMPNASARLEDFIQEMVNEDVDFIVQLGDFCHPTQENKPFLQVWNQFKGPRYHVLGNHDMDRNDKQTMMDYLGMQSSYYSFDQGEFHFVVLDGNYLKRGDQYVDYDHANYGRYPHLVDHISSEQLEWLRKDLRETKKHTIIFSHQNLDDSELGLKNGSELREIFRIANEAAGYQKVVACFNGHNHLDGVKVIDSIYYIHVNSMSYYYMGEEYDVIRYSEEVTAKYPILAKSAPYEDALYAVVTIGAGLITISGRESQYVGPSPRACGHPNMAGGHEVSARISSRQLHY